MGSDKAATVASDGTWSLTVSTADLKADAANELTAVQTDDAGNVSSAASFTVTTDFSVDTPVITAVSSDNIVGASEIAGSATVTLSGTGEAGAAVTVTGGAATKTDTVYSDGSWSVDLSSADLNADATTDFSVTQTDLVGNVSTAATVTVTTDLQAPAEPAINDVSTDNLVNAFENSGGFNLTGTGEADATVTVSGFVTGAKTATVGSGGTWSVAVAEGDLAPNADTTLSATQADVAGNTSVASATKIVATDLVGASPTVSLLANSGTLDLDYLDAMKTSGEDVFASGTAENGATVTVSLTPTIEATTTADASDGSWSINVSDLTPSISTDNVITVGAGTDTLSLAHGSDYTVSVKIQDVAGNTSPTVTETLTIDTPPLKVTVNDTTGVVTVAGTATGKLEVTVAADGTATFARYDAAGTTKSTITDIVADFYGKQFVGTTYNSLTDLEITVDGGKLVEESLYNPNLATADVRYVIVDAPEAEKVVLKGDLGTAAQKNVVIIRVADDNVGALDTSNILVDTSGLSNVASNDVFEIEMLETSRNDHQTTGSGDDGLGATGVDKDAVVFDYNTSIDGFGLYQIQNGEVSWYTLLLDSNGDIQWDPNYSGNTVPLLKFFAATSAQKDAFSTIALSLEELEASTQFINFLDTGTLKIQIFEGQESALETFVSNSPSLKIVGFDVQVEKMVFNSTTLKFDATAYDITGSATETGLAAMTFDGFVETQAAIEALSSDVKGGAWSSANYQNLTTVSAKLDGLDAAITTLNSGASVTGSVAKSIADTVGTASTGWNATTGNFDTAGSGLFADVETLIDGAVTYLEGQVTTLDTDLQTQITSNDNDIAANVTSIGTNATAITALETQGGVQAASISELASRAATLEADVLSLEGAVGAAADAAAINGSLFARLAALRVDFDAAIDNLVKLIGPGAPAVSIDPVTGALTVSVSDSDGVTSIAIYDGSTNIIDPATGEDGFVLKSGSPSTANGETTYVFELVGDVQDIPLTLTVKAVDAQGAE